MNRAHSHFGYVNSPGLSLFMLRCASCTWHLHPIRLAFPNQSPRASTSVLFILALRVMTMVRTPVGTLAPKVAIDRSPTAPDILAEKGILPMRKKNRKRASVVEFSMQELHHILCLSLAWFLVYQLHCSAKHCCFERSLSEIQSVPFPRSVITCTISFSIG